jgi:secreted trypsin-like serine protease
MACGPVGFDGTASVDEGDEFETNEQEIVGGVLAKEGEFPYIVPLFYRYADGSGGLAENHGCGGVLIEPDLVLTAAHCIWDFNAVNMTAGYGKLNLSELPRLANGLLVADGKHAARVKAVYPHPDYDNGSMDSDAALLRLDRPLQTPRLVDYVHNSANDPGPRTLLQIAGWGATNKRGDRFEDELRRATVGVYANTTCEKAIQRFEGHRDPVITDTMICAGGGTADTCYGDSGGPMFGKLKNGGMKVVGLTSFGATNPDRPNLQCAIPKVPGVYTRISKLATWIDSCRKDANTCAWRRGPTSCTVYGICYNQNKEYISIDLSDSIRDAATCFSQAAKQYQQCGNPKVVSGYEENFTARFTDPSGSRIVPAPGCVVWGDVCRNKKYDFGTLHYDSNGTSRETCFALGKKYYEACANRPGEAITTEWWSDPAKYVYQSYSQP